MAGPALNYYLGLKRADNNNIDNVVSTNSVNAGPAQGTAADVEVRIQANDGSNNTGITREDVVMQLNIIIQYILSGNPASAGANLPAL